MQQLKQQSTDQCYQFQTKQLFKKYPFSSLFLPVNSRKPIYAIHAFTIMASNIVTNTEISMENKLALLDEMAHKLDKLRYGKSINEAVFIALAETIERYDLPVSLFHELLKAYRTQLTLQRFENFGELMEYCRHSAVPIGRLLLHVLGAVSLKNTAYTDAISSAIQLNYCLQNIEVELSTYNRLYIPLDELEKYKISEQMLLTKPFDSQVQQLMKSQVNRAQQLLQSAAYLGKRLKGFAGIECRLIIAGTNIMLQKMHENSYQANLQTQLYFKDGIWMLYKALLSI